VSDADPNDLKHYAEANARVVPPNKLLPRVVFIGDSITESWRLNEYFTGRDFINRGIADQTTAQMLGRFRQDVVGLNPRAVLIHGGTNDVAQGIAPEVVEANLAQMGNIAKSRGIKAIFASILPVSDYHKDVDPKYEMTKTRSNATIKQINDWLKDFCRREKFSYVDYVPTLADPNGQLTAAFADDGFHPNARGYRLMSPLVLEGIGRALSTP